MTAPEALRDMILIAIVVVVPAVWIEPLVEKRRAKRAAQVAEAERFLAQGAIQSALDDAYALAEQQAPAQAETGQGWAMPSREQIEAATSDGAHDQDESVSDTDQALLIAALDDAFFHQERPRSATKTDPGAFDAW